MAAFTVPALLAETARRQPGVAARLADLPRIVDDLAGRWSLRVGDVLQHMLNCERLAADPAGLCDRMAGLAGADPVRVRLWLFARAVQESAGSAGWSGSAVLREVAVRLAPA